MTRRSPQSLQNQALRRMLTKLPKNAADQQIADANPARLAAIQRRRAGPPADTVVPTAQSQARCHRCDQFVNATLIALRIHYYETCPELPKNQPERALSIIQGGTSRE